MSPRPASRRRHHGESLGTGACLWCEKAGAAHIRLGAPLVWGWCKGGECLVLPLKWLETPGDGLGSLSATRGYDAPTKVTAAVPLAPVEKVCWNRALADRRFNGGSRLVSIASNGRVLRTRPCLVPHGSPDGSLRAGGDFAALRAAQPRKVGVSP